MTKLPTAPITTILAVVIGTARVRSPRHLAPAIGQSTFDIPQGQ